MQTTTRKQYKANNVIVRSLAKKYGFQYSGSYSSFLPTAKRTKLWHCDIIVPSVWKKFVRELKAAIPTLKSVEYRTFNVKEVGEMYVQAYGFCKSVYVYYV